MKWHYLLILSALLGCRQEATAPRTEAGTPTEDLNVAEPAGQATEQTGWEEQTTANLKNLLRESYLKDQLGALSDSDRVFQWAGADLNDDGQKELFVRFMSPYFCGTGGCTFLLLDPYGELITTFTVTRAPIFVEPTSVNGWKVLLVKDGGVFKELRYENGTYPPNPSVVPKAPYDAPSGHALVLFDQDSITERF